MTRQECIFDALMILEGGGITEESRVDEDYIGYKIDQHRAKEIKDTFNRKPVIESVWLQDYGIFDLTPVNKAEDRTITVCDCSFAKAVLPPVVSISDPLGNIPDIGTYSIRSSCGTYEFHYQNITKLSLLSKDSILSNFRYYTKVLNSHYLTPVAQKARAILILEHPLDGYVLDNTDKVSGTLVNGTVYEVRSGNVTYNGTKYFKGSTFTATATTTFTGTGKVFLNNQKRRMINTDPYPMSQTMAEVVLNKLFTLDYGMEAKFISDIKNDAEDQFRVLKAAQSAG